MNIFSKNKILKYLAYVMVVTQGMLLAWVMSFHIDAKYFDDLLAYPNSAITINIKAVPEKKTNATLSYMQDYAQEKGVFFIRKDFIINKDHSIGGLSIGIDGDYEKNKDDIQFSYLGQSVIKGDDIKELLSRNDDAVLGIEHSSLHSIGKIPKFKFGNNIVIKKLDKMVEETNTINGEYKILGLHEENIDDFIEGLSKSSGVSKEVLLDNKSGYVLDIGLMQNFLWISLGAHSLVLLALLVVITAKSLPDLGKLILQGWSKIDFAFNLYAPYFLIGFMSVFLFIGYGIYLTEGTFLSLTYFSLMVVIGLFNLLLLTILMAISSVFILIVKPIDAIRDRFPKKIYIFSGLILYIIFNILMICGCSYIDGPFREIQKNTQIAQKWHEVSNYYILKSLTIGNDQSSFNQQSKKFYTDIYHWYQSIADDEGVYIINTTYFSDSMLKKYKANKLYESIPDKSLWVFKMSPSYLKKIGLDIDENAIAMAKEGQRVYLIPDNIAKNENKIIRNWLKEKDTKSIREDDIETVFNKEKKFNFVKYHSDYNFFSWDTDLEKSINVKNPVILLVTPNNMIFKESESLSAKGLASSYLKLDENAAKKYLDSTYLRKFNLDDNDIQFSKVKFFVDGLQKEIWKTIQLFFSMILAITFIVIALLITIISVFQMAYKEVISVKRFLGYGNIQIYSLPAIIIWIIMIADWIAIFILESRFGIVYVSIVNILQLFIFYKVIVNNEFKKIADYLKS